MLHVHIYITVLYSMFVSVLCVIYVLSHSTCPVSVPAETQQRRNDSFQVSACFQQEDHSPQDNGDTRGKGVTAEDRASGAAAAGPARSDGGDTGSSCCPLHELKRLPECGVTLGELRFSDTHTVLIDVRLVFLTLLLSTFTPDSSPRQYLL